jgi:predicted HAD superfamily Cof-like phosphohydrolase
MKKEQEAVKDFHKEFGIAISESLTLSDEKVRKLRVKLIWEELNELMEAYNNKDLVEVADALGDLMYVVLGAAVSHGINLEAVFWEIHRSNMTKVGGHKDESGKWIKPDTYDPADIKGIIEK